MDENSNENEIHIAFTKPTSFYLNSETLSQRDFRFYEAITATYHITQYNFKLPFDLHYPIEELNELVNVFINSNYNNILKIMKNANNDKIIEIKQNIFFRNLNENIYKQYLSNFDIETCSLLMNLKEKSVKTIKKRAKKYKKSTKINQIQYELLRNYMSIDTNKVKTLSQILKEVNNQIFIEKNLKRTTLYRILTHKDYLNLSFKKVKNYYFPYNIYNTIGYKIEEYNFINNYIFCLQNNYKVIYVDETGINLNLNHVYGYEIKTKKLFLQKNQKKSENYSLICAITNTTVLGGLVVKGAVNGDIFFSFLMETIIRYALNNEKYIFIMDNAKIHHTIKLIQKFDCCISILYVPAYTPYYNAIECYFGLLKHKLRGSDLSGEELLVESINKMILDVSERQLSGFELNVLRNIQRRLNGQCFK